jgi:peptide methionine sulfoxide reductase MsrB
MGKVIRSDAEWRERLTPEEYAVLRQAATEAPFTGEGYDVPTDERWCINSVSLTLEPAADG